MTLTEEIDALAEEVRAKWLLVDVGLPVEGFMKMVAADSTLTWEAFRLIARRIDAGE
ncbi:hypothetical protein QN345_17880 [Cryobacterium sp. 10I1]|uniref:hypothetical protein n=1 Tax=unclassified Cryobacterium TaxID=2649013 RepID=UPI002B2361BD|nr:MULTISPECIES: hypothetical protein [unclassified Cryobacterium]MEB0002434.1 hypothetical protein [Cryobacterium sp. RTC2.1]MEB0307170.1 hypothetical protein [Cryobacterium sp. 10I1]